MDLMACVFHDAHDAALTAGRVQSVLSDRETECESLAVVRWDLEGRLPRSEVPATGSRNSTAAWFWSLVLGLTFSIPALGAELGSASGLESGALTAAGIQDGFMNRLRDEVVPGRSALLLLTGPAAALLVKGLLHQREVPVLATITFTPRQEAALLDVLS